MFNLNPGTDCLKSISLREVSNATTRTATSLRFQTERQRNEQGKRPSSYNPLDTRLGKKEPTEKKAVLYLGKLKPGVKESEIIDYVNKRSEKLGAPPTTIHNCKIFEKEVEECEIIEFCGARLTIDKRSSKLLCQRKFWLGPSYARPWN